MRLCSLKGNLHKTTSTPSASPMTESFILLVLLKVWKLCISFIFRFIVISLILRFLEGTDLIFVFYTCHGKSVLNGNPNFKFSVYIHYFFDFILNLRPNISKSSESLEEVEEVFQENFSFPDTVQKLLHLNTNLANKCLMRPTKNVPDVCKSFPVTS